MMRKKQKLSEPMVKREKIISKYNGIDPMGQKAMAVVRKFSSEVINLPHDGYFIY